MYKKTLYFHDYGEAKEKRIEALEEKDVVNAFLYVYKENPVQALNEETNTFEQFEYILDIYYRSY